MRDEQPTDDESEPLPADKAELLERMGQARTALEQRLGQLNEALLVASGPDEGWSIKDHLAHLAAWERGIAALLQRQPRYAAMQIDEETYLNSDANSVNTIIYQQNRERSLGEVLATFRQAHQEVLAALTPLSDADLFRTYAHYQPDEPGKDSGAPILGWIAGNTYEHYTEHQGWIEVLVRDAGP